jgi:hypothetical protein
LRSQRSILEKTFFQIERTAINQREAGCFCFVEKTALECWEGEYGKFHYPTVKTERRYARHGNPIGVGVGIGIEEN